jgi:acetylornithine/N-succinyldiaminopimelate aminotransferase
MGRLGEWFGFQTAGIAPDAISLAKGLGGGFPIGAMLTSEALGAALPPGTHGSTYGGNPLGSAAASAVISILAKEKLVAGAKAKGEYLQNALNGVAKDHAKVCEGARGAGLLQGLVLKQGFVARDILGKLVDKGVLLTAAGERVIRFTPPLVVTEAELARGVQAVREVVSTLG